MDITMKTVVRRFFAFVLALVLVAGSIDMSSLSVLAADTSGSKELNMNYSLYTLKQGKKVTLKVKAGPKAVKWKELAWESSNEKVALVSSKGVVKGLEKGDAVITATVKSTGLKSSCRVTVGTPVKKVIISGSKKMVVEVGQTAAVLAKVEPAGASNQGLKYLSNKPQIAVVDEKGNILGIKTGTARITIMAADGSKKKAKVKVKVVKADPNRRPAPTTEVTATPTTETTAAPTTEVTAAPTTEVTAAPTTETTAAPTAEVTATPTAETTAAPTAEATAAPTAEATAAPNTETTAAPTAEATAAPTAETTAAPTAETTAAPTAEATAAPTAEATAAPTAEITAAPTAEATAVPTAEATAVPTGMPATEPAAEASATPAIKPTAAPSAVPTKAPDSAEDTKEYTIIIYDGNIKLKDVKKPEKYPLKDLTAPYQEGKIFLGWYYDKELTKKVSKEDILLQDLSLYASYGDAVPLSEGGSSNFASAVDVSKDFSIIVDAHDNTASEAKVHSALKLNNLSSVSKAEETLTVKSLGNGRFSVSANGGFEEGATYKLEIIRDDSTAELTFDGCSKEVIYYNFTVARQEVLNVSLDGNLKYLQASKLSTEDGEKVLAYSGLYQVKTDESGNQVYEATDTVGTFTYNNNAYIPGDIIAVYKGEKPDERDLTTQNNSEIAYIEITNIELKNGSTIYSYKSAKAADVLFTPDVLPVDIDAGDGVTGWTNDGRDFTVATSKLDFKTGYESVGLDYQTEVEPGDFLAFYSGDFGVDSMESRGYGKITSISENGVNTIVNYAVVTPEDVFASMDLYNRSDVSKEQLNEIDSQLVSSIVTEQVMESGFAQEAGKYLASLAVETDEVKNLLGEEELSLKDCIITYPDGTPVDSEDSALIGAALSEGGEGLPEVNVNVSTKLEHFEEGNGVRVELAVKYGFDIQKTGSKKKIAIEMTAIFEDEVLLKVSTSGKAIWKTMGIIPYVDDYQMTANIDQGLYTGIAITATAQLDEDEEPFGPELLKPEGLDDYGKKILDIGDSIKKMMEANKALEPESEGSATGGLIEKYTNFIENANDKWIDVVDVPIMSVAGNVDPFYVLAYSFDANFVVSANLNVAIGMSFQYEKSQRQTFTVRLFKPINSKCETVDLGEEYFQFDFYVMGTLGIRAGIRAKVLFGLFSTKLDGVGVQLEAGAYARLWGYFYYCLSWDKSKGKTSSATGAMYIEIGAYMDVNLCLEVLNGTFAFNPELYSGEWPIWSVGEQENVLDFTYDKYETDSFDMIRETSMEIPSDIFDMKYLDLKEGGEGEKNYDGNARASLQPLSSKYDDEKRFFVEISKPFVYNPINNTISIVPEKGYYSYEGTLTFTWKQPDITYASKPLSRTFEVTWTDPDKGTCLFFNTNGGSLIKTQHGNPDVEIKPVENPVKVGYVFDGWYSDEGLKNKTDVPKVMPDTDTTLYAKWIPVPNKYKVLHKYEDLNKSYLLQEVNVQENNVSANKRVYTDDVISQNQVINDNKILKTGFEIDYENTTKSAKIAPDGSTVVSIYYKRVAHTVTYTMGDLKDKDNPDVVNSYRYEEPIYAPTFYMTGYTFKGWDKEIPKTMALEDLTYNAVWEANSNIPYYLEYYVEDPLTEKYMMLGGQLGRIYKEGITNEKISVSENLLKQEGYIFEKVTVNGVERGKNDYGVVDAQGRLTIRYYYRPISYNISFDEGYGALLMSEVPDHYYAGSVIDLSDITAQKTGYIFKGWVESEKAREVLTEISSTRTGDIALIARWEKKKNTIKLYDGDKSIGSISAAYEEMIPALDSIPEKNGYEFVGFYTEDGINYYDKNGAGHIFWEQVKDINLNAKWTPGKVSISFNAAGGEAVPQMEGTFLKKYPKLPAATKTGYVFGGWTLDGALITEDSIINKASDNVLVAKWNPAKNTAYTVECYVPSESYTDEKPEYKLDHSVLALGETDSKVTIDALEYTFPGYTLLSDYKDNVVTATIAADGSTVFKLYFRENTKYAVAFTYSTEDYKNTLESTVTLVAEGTEITLPSYNEDSKMELTGWRLNGVFYKPLSTYTVGSKDVEFVAVWRVKEFIVSYHNIVNSFEAFIEPAYEYGTEVSVLPFMMDTPLQKNEETGKWEYKEFLGWFTSYEGDEGKWYQPGDILSNIGDIVNEDGKLILFAKWGEWKELTDGAYYVKNDIEDGSENNWKYFKTIQSGTVSEKTHVDAVILPKNTVKEITQETITALDFEKEDSPIVTEVLVKNELIPHSVSLDYNGGQLDGKTGKSSGMKPGSGLFEYNNVIPEKAGYKFIGWSEYLPDYMGNYDIHAVAQYEETGVYAVRVKYMTENVDGSGYTETASNVIYEKPGSFKLNKVPSFSGFTAQEAPEITVEENNDNVYELRYDRKSFTVTWNPGEGELSEGSENTVSVKFGCSIPAGPSLVRDGYRGSWKNVPSVMPAGDLTIMPEWTAQKVGYDVIYQYETVDGHFGTIVSYHREDYAGTMLEISADIPDSAVEDEKALVAKGYVKPFAQTVTLEGDGSTKVYFKYNLIRSNLSYDLAGGTTTTSNYAQPGVYRYGQTLQIPVLSQVKKDGYKAVGWYNAADAEKKVITERTITIGEEDVTYQMKWEPETYTITYDLNITGANNETNPALYYPGFDFNISGAVKEGYAFKTWEWNGEGSMPEGVSITNGVVHVTDKARGNLSFKAVWEQYYKQFTALMYEGASEMYTANYPEDVDACISDIPVPSRDGYVFAYWTKKVPDSDSGYFTVKIRDTTRVSTLNVNTDFVAAYWMKTSEMPGGSYSIHVNSETEWEKAVGLLKSNPEYKGITVDSDFKISRISTPVFESLEAGYVIDGDDHEVEVGILQEAIVRKNYGTITNLKITGIINNTVENQADSSFGAFTEENYGTVKGCVLGYNSSLLNYRMSLMSNAAYVGGIAGKNHGTLDNCIVRNVTVSLRSDILGENAAAYAGGIAGYNAIEGNLIRCSVKDSSISCRGYDMGVSKNQMIYTGGAAGKNTGLISRADIRNTYVGHSLTGDGTVAGKLYAGGFAGIDEVYEQETPDKGSRGISNCSSKGVTVYSDYVAGGIMAECNYTELRDNVLEDIVITGNRYAGIMAGIYGYAKEVPGYNYISKTRVETGENGNACVIGGYGRNRGESGKVFFLIRVRSKDNLTKVVNGATAVTYNKGMFTGEFKSTMKDYYLDMNILAEKW